MRFRWKLALALVLAATGPVLVITATSLRILEGRFEREMASRFDAGARAALDLLGDRGAQVERQVREMAESKDLEDVAAAVKAGLLTGVDLEEKGEALMRLSGLDLFSVLDRTGRVVTSGHLPKSLGTVDQDALRVADAAGTAVPVLARVRAGDELLRALGLVAAQPLDYAALRLWVIGGRRLDAAFAERVGRASGTTVVVADREGELARSGDVPASGPERALALGAADAPVATLTLYLSDEPLKANRRAVLLVVAAALGVFVALAGALAAALSPLVTRPVEALARGAKAIARGELGHQVRVSASGELGDLVATFNEMSRKLRTTTERAAIAERIAAWRDVGRRLAHEIKNPLTPIQMSMETALDAHAARRPDFDEIFRESARAALEEVARLRRIVDEFSRFARLPPPQPSDLDLSEVAASVLALYSVPPEGIAIVRELDPDLRVSADRDQVAQVLINLVRNAEQAIRAGRPGGAGRIVVRTRRPAPEEAALEVEDDGPGVPLADRERVFEPYYTTKEGGTGLGLAIAHRIAQEHGGRLEVGGEPGRGAVFRLVLPTRGAEAEGRERGPGADAA